jgi:DNA-binding transcriptional MerR regulator
VHVEQELTPLHQIGAVADRVGLSLRTIRHYGEVGLVIPSGRSSGGFRLYTEADIERLAQVKVMKPLGLTLEETARLLELRQIMRGGAATAAQTDELRELADRGDVRCRELQARLDAARTFSDALRAETNHHRAAATASTGSTAPTEDLPWH